jgi:hypothetical protein
MDITKTVVVVGFVLIIVSGIVGFASDLQELYGGEIINQQLSDSYNEVQGLNNEFYDIGVNTNAQLVPGSGEGEEDVEIGALRRAYRTFTGIPDLVNFMQEFITQSAGAIGLDSDSVIVRTAITILIIVFSISFALLIASVVRGIFR